MLVARYRFIHLPLFFFLTVFTACAAFAQKDSAFREDFEAGNKTTYAAATLMMGSGSWQLESALIGKLDNDHKNGSAALRMKAGGQATTLFDLPVGVNEIHFSFASFGNDGSSRITVSTSGDSGKSWTTSTQIWTGPALKPAVVAINPSKSFRLRIQNEGPWKVNVDDLSLTFAQVFLPGQQGRDNPLTLGNPTHASKENRENYLLIHPQYTLSYCATKGHANWVAWHLSADWEGNADRCNCFRQDDSLPSAFYHVSSSNYINSGFDRGHLCPSDDRSKNDTDNAATFLMSNIVPQAPQLNQNSWKMLETYARSLSAQGFEVYSFAGVYGVGGIGKKNEVTTSLADGKLEVPAHFWKVLVILPKGENDLSRIDKNTRVIAVDMPNDQNRGDENWKNFRCSVASIESVAGCRFFEMLPKDVADALKSKVDNE
jgi:endonuclease G